MTEKVAIVWLKQNESISCHTKHSTRCKYSMKKDRQNFETIKRKWVEIWSKDFGHKKISIDVKCGINTGAVLFGLLDTDTRSQVTILGSPVNLASRLESVAENDQIIISPYVKDLIQSEFNLQRVVPTEPIRSYPEIGIVYEVKG